MHRLRKSLSDLYLTALSLSRFSFSAICSLFLSDDPSCREQCVVSLFSSAISVDVEVCSTSIVGVSSSRFLLDGILLFPSEDGVVSIFLFLVNLDIYSSLFHLATDQSQYLMVIGDWDEWWFEQSVS